MTTARRIGSRRDTYQHLNISQKDALLETMRQNPKLALNGYSTIERQLMWNALARYLNLHGPQKTGAQWEASWKRYRSRAKNDPGCDTYRPVTDVVKYCEAQLAQLNANNLDNSAASNQDNVGRRRSSPMNSDDIEQILHQLNESNQKRGDLGKQIEEFQAEVKAMMNKLTRNARARRQVRAQ